MDDVTAQPALTPDPVDPVSGVRPTEAVAPERQINYEADGEKLMRRCLADAKANTARILRDRQDILNLKFDRGGRDNQWCVWDQGTTRYVARGENPDHGGLPAWIPRPVTNVLHTTIKGLTSILDQSEPAQAYAPKTDDDADQATADVVEDAVPVLREECGYDSQGHRHELNRMVTLMDKAAYIVYYDDDEKYGEQDVDLFTCSNPDCGQVVTPLDVEQADGCPNCGNQDTESFQLVTHPQTGMPMGLPQPVGKMCAEVLSSLEFSVPASARRANTKAMPWILTHNRMDPHEIERFWEKAAGISTEKSTWSDGALTRAYADEMRRLSSPTTGGPLGGGPSAVDGPVVYRLWHDPVEDDEVYLPEGFYGVMIGDRLVEFTKLPFTDADGVPMKNILLRTWDPGVATAFGHPPCDDLVPIQQSRNLTQAMIELIIMHDAAPTTYVPDTVTFIDEPTGVPGDQVRYRSMDGQKPTESRGTNPPQALFEYLDQQDAKMQQVSGLNAVLVGERPAGDPTLGEVQLLEERGMATFRAPLDGLIDFERDLSFLLLSIGRQSAWSPRFRRIRGENGQWELKAFAAADLGGQIDIVVSRASAWPRSPLMQQLRIKEALSMGVLPPPAQDPELQAKLLLDMNLAHLKPSYDTDRRQVARELERWKEARSPQDIRPPNPQTQNLQIHLYLKKEFLKSEDADRLEEANPGVWQAMLMHISQIQTLLAPPPPAPVLPPDKPPEKGSKSVLEHAVARGDLQPDHGDGKTPQTKGRALDALVASGQLVPEGAAPPPSAPGMPPAMPGGQMAPPVTPGPSSDDLADEEMRQPVLPPSPA